MTPEEAIDTVLRGDRVTGPYTQEIPCPRASHAWRTLFCDGDTDVIECAYCGRQDVATCDFEDEFA